MLDVVCIEIVVFKQEADALALYLDWIVNILIFSIHGKGCKKSLLS